MALAAAVETNKVVSIYSVTVLFRIHFGGKGCASLVLNSISSP